MKKSSDKDLCTQQKTLGWLFHRVEHHIVNSVNRKRARATETTERATVQVKES